MFPEETHVKIIQRIDEIEARLFGLYCSLENVRLELQNQWHVLPNGERWTEDKSEATRHSAQGVSR